MAKFVCLLLVLAVLVNTGLSLKCYDCKSEQVDGCLKSSKPKEITCGNAAQGYKQVCYYREFYDTNKKVTMVNSSCASMPTNSDSSDSLNECAVTAGVTKKECRSCMTDLCNSAPALSTSFFVILCLPAMYFVSKLF